MVAKKGPGQIATAAEVKKTQVATPDLTPTWTGMMPVLIALIANGEEDGRKAAEVELMRLAGIVDRLSSKAEG